jgi:AraC-like DNA-binding protein
MMTVEEIPPIPALRPFVRNYLLVNLPPTPYNIKPYPVRVEQALAFFARGFIHSHDLVSGTHYRVARNALFGQQVNRLNFATHFESDFLMLMVIFQPGALYRLLGFSSQELTTQFTDAEAIMGQELQLVNDRIANALSNKEIIEHVETFLLAKLNNVKKDVHGVDKIGQLLLHQPMDFSLDRLANQACLSPRQFERLFSERMGVGPKLFSRINRFFHAFQYKETHPNEDWLTVALDFGYTDYNHLAKDCKHFAHVTPNILLNQHSLRPELMALLNR